MTDNNQIPCNMSGHTDLVRRVTNAGEGVIRATIIIVFGWVGPPQRDWSGRSGG